MPSTPKPNQPKPTAAHKRFEIFIGNWHAEGTSYGDGQDALIGVCINWGQTPLLLLFGSKVRIEPQGTLLRSTGLVGQLNGPLVTRHPTKDTS